MPVRCAECDCVRVATCAYPESKRSRFCNVHKKSGMVIVLAGCCNADGCDKQPSFGFIGEKPRFCASHKLGGMTDVKNKRCEAPGCGKTPNFAEEGQKPRFCSAHKFPDHVNVKGPFCYVENCRRRRALSRFCIDHLDSSCCSKSEENNQLEALKIEVERLRIDMKTRENRIKQLEQELSLREMPSSMANENMMDSSGRIIQVTDSAGNNFLTALPKYSAKHRYMEYPEGSTAFAGNTSRSFPFTMAPTVPQEHQDGYPNRRFMTHPINTDENARFYTDLEDTYQTSGGQNRRNESSIQSHSQGGPNASTFSSNLVLGATRSQVTSTNFNALPLDTPLQGQFEPSKGCLGSQINHGNMIKQHGFNYHSQSLAYQNIGMSGGWNPQKNMIQEGLGINNIGSNYRTLLPTPYESSEAPN